MGHFGRVLETLQPFPEPREADATIPIFQIKKVRSLWSAECGDSQTVGARFKFYFLSCRGLSTEGTFQGGWWSKRKSILGKAVSLF